MLPLYPSLSARGCFYSLGRTTGCHSENLGFTLRDINTCTGDYGGVSDTYVEYGLYAPRVQVRFGTWPGFSHGLFWCIMLASTFGGLSVR